jgi:hypothetical protein
MLLGFYKNKIRLLFYSLVLKHKAHYLYLVNYYVYLIYIYIYMLFNVKAFIMPF